MMAEAPLHVEEMASPMVKAKPSMRDGEDNAREREEDNSMEDDKDDTKEATTEANEVKINKAEAELPKLIVADQTNMNTAVTNQAIANPTDAITNQPTKKKVSAKTVTKLSETPRSQTQRSQQQIVLT